MGTKVSVNRTSRYAPIRYEATRPYAIRLGRAFAKEAAKGERARLDFLERDLMHLLPNEVARLGEAVSPGPVQGEVANIQIIGGFLGGGRIIFDVCNVLAKSLLVTDVDDIPCGSITLPSSSFYLHFGRGTGLVENGFEIEGAFLQHLPSEQKLLVELVPFGAFGVSAFWALPMGEQLTGASIDISHKDESAIHALDRSVDSMIEQTRKDLEQYAELERTLTAQYGRPVKIPTPVENLAEKRPLLRDALRLCLNTLFFLTAAPDDVVEGWEDDAPTDLVTRTNAEKPGARLTAENTLGNQGYVKVRYVGRRYAAQTEAVEVASAVGAGRTVATHFRRGHFRRQPFGEGRSLRKTIFVAPMIINADKGPGPGRIYEVNVDHDG